MTGTVRDGRQLPEPAGRRWKDHPAWERLRRYSLSTWGFQWQMPDTGEQIDCGFWRRRRDIGNIMEITEGPHQSLLLARALEDYHQRGAVLVLAIPHEAQRGLRVWQESDFRPIEEVVQYRLVLSQGQEPAYEPGALHFRRYTPDDRDAVLALEREAFPWIWWSSAAELSYYDRLMGTQFWVASLPGRGGDVVALLGMTLSIGVGHIDRLAVSPRLQRRGLGMETLTFGLSRLWRQGIRRVTLLTQHDNFRSQALYYRAGFVPTSWRQRLYGLCLDPAARQAMEHDRAV